MRFSFPEVPDEHRDSSAEEKKHTRHESEMQSHSGSYDALLAKLGRKKSDSTETSEPAKAETKPAEKITAPAEKISTPANKIAIHFNSLPLPFSDADDDGFEVDSKDAEAVEAAMPSQITGPMAKLSTLISWVMVPLIMPVVTMILMLWLSELRQLPGKEKVILVLITAGFNTVLPMVLIGLLKLMGIIRDMGLNYRRERMIPYIITIAGLVLTAVYLHHQGAPEWMWGVYVGAAIASAVCSIVNLWWKISAHATGASGVIATLIIIGSLGHSPFSMNWWIVGACLLTGLMGSARVFLRRHTDLQVLAGYVCGFCCVYFTTLYFS